MRVTKPLLSEENIEDRKRSYKRVISEGFNLENARGKKQRVHYILTDKPPIEIFAKPNQENIRARTSNPETQFNDLNEGLK